MPDDPLDALNQPAVNELSPTVIQPMEQPVAAGENPVVIAEIDAYKETPLGGREYLNAPGLEVDGPFLEAYERNGGPRSFLGLPTSKRHGSFDGARAEVQTFAGGTLIRALDQQMAYALTPPLAAAWSDQQLWNTLGFPVGDDKDLDEHHGRWLRSARSRATGLVARWGCSRGPQRSTTLRRLRLLRGDQRRRLRRTVLRVLDRHRNPGRGSNPGLQQHHCRQWWAGSPGEAALPG